MTEIEPTIDNVRPGGDVCLCDRFDLDRDDLPTNGTFTTTWEES